MGILTINPSLPRNQSYRGGQTITGTVTYTMTMQETVDDVSITFAGTSHSDVITKSNNHTHHHREKIPFFSFFTQLYKGHYTMQKQVLEWPFEFRLPEVTTHVRESSNRDDAMFKSQPHPLPPSFAIKTPRGSASVEYNLEARVNAGRIFHSTSTSLPIRFVETRFYDSSSELYPQPASRYTFPPGIWSSNTLRPTPHTLKQKLAHTFTSDPALATPTISFVLEASVPLSGTLWTPLPISLLLKHTSKRQNDPETPTLMLERISVELKAYTNIRSQGYRTYTDDTSALVASAALPLPSLNVESTKSLDVPLSTRGRRGVQMPLDATPVPLTVDGVCLAGFTQHDIGLIPDFSSYTVAHSHKLRMRATVRHIESGKLFEIEGPKVGFRLEVPEPGQDEGGVGSEGMAMRVSGRGSEHENGWEGEMLPVYRAEGEQQQAQQSASTSAATNALPSPPVYPGEPSNMGFEMKRGIEGAG